MPDDDLINEMIARSEEELEIFKQIDLERKKVETQSRLIEESELPDWLVKDDDEVICSKVCFLIQHQIQIWSKMYTLHVFTSNYNRYIMEYSKST